MALFNLYSLTKLRLVPQRSILYSRTFSHNTLAPQRLAHEVIASAAGGGDRTLLLLHGLLGNRKNLKSFAKSIVAAHPRYEVLLMDLRGHGETPLLNSSSQSSPPSGQSATLADAAADVAFTLNSIGIGTPDTVCGHSMGGKVALAYLEAAAEGQWADQYFGLHGVPRSVWTLDSIPGPVPDRPSLDEKESVASVLAAVAQVKVPVASKADVAAQLEALGCSKATAQWMTTNLRSVVDPETGSKGFDFVFELETCKALFADYAIQNFLPLVRQSAEGELECSIDVVRAGRNKSSWPPERVADLESAAASGQPSDSGQNMAQVHLLPNSGHNVHIEAPEALLSFMETRLKE